MGPGRGGDATGGHARIGALRSTSGARTVRQNVEHGDPRVVDATPGQGLAVPDEPSLALDEVERMRAHLDQLQARTSPGREPPGLAL